MFSQSIRILGTIAKALSEDELFEVSLFFDIAVLCGSIRGASSDNASLEFTLGEMENVNYAGLGYKLRPVLGFIGLNVDHIRFPELGESAVFTAEEIEHEALRLNVPLHLAEDEVEDFHARVVREETGHKEPPRRLAQVYANLSTRRRREQEERGIERVNKYGFEVSLDYPFAEGEIVPLQVKVANDSRNPPYFFCIKRTDR